MARQRNLLINIDRMRREMDEMLGDPWTGQARTSRGPSGFSPRVDVYYCKSAAEQAEGEGEAAEATPKAVVKADLAGVDPDAVNLEISGRTLVLTGERPVRETEGRAYQQVEIPTGRFRRVIELGVDVVSSEARATFEDGMLRVELPVRVPESSSRTVPIERRD